MRVYTFWSKLEDAIDARVDAEGRVATAYEWGSIRSTNEKAAELADLLVEARDREARLLSIVRHYRRERDWARADAEVALLAAAERRERLHTETKP